MYKIRKLTGLYDSYGSSPNFVHLPFSFRSLDLFVASLLFVKGTSHCVILKEKIEPLDRAMTRGHMSA